MRVSSTGRPTITLTHDGADAGKRHIQAHRLGQLGREQAELHLAGAAGFGVKCDGKNRGLWRMRLKIEMQQLDPELSVCGWQRRPNRSAMRPPPSRDSVMVTEASAKMRAFARRMNCSSMTPTTKSSESSNSTGVSNSIRSSSSKAGSTARNRCGNSPRASWRRRLPSCPMRAISSFSGRAASIPSVRMPHIANVSV